MVVSAHYKSLLLLLLLLHLISDIADSIHFDESKNTSVPTSRDISVTGTRLIDQSPCNTLYAKS